MQKQLIKLTLDKKESNLIKDDETVIFEDSRNVTPNRMTSSSTRVRQVIDITSAERPKQLKNQFQLQLQQQLYHNLPDNLGSKNPSYSNNCKSSNQNQKENLDVFPVKEEFQYQRLFSEETSETLQIQQQYNQNYTSTKINNKSQNNQQINKLHLVVQNKNQQLEELAFNFNKLKNQFDEKQGKYLRLIDKNDDKYRIIKNLETQLSNKDSQIVQKDEFIQKLHEKIIGITQENSHLKLEKQENQKIIEEYNNIKDDVNQMQLIQEENQRLKRQLKGKMTIQQFSQNQREIQVWEKQLFRLKKAEIIDIVCELLKILKAKRRMAEANQLIDEKQNFRKAERRLNYYLNRAKKLQAENKEVKLCLKQEQKQNQEYQAQIQQQQQQQQQQPIVKRGRGRPRKI